MQDSKPREGKTHEDTRRKTRRLFAISSMTERLTCQLYLAFSFLALQTEEGLLPSGVIVPFVANE